MAKIEFSLVELEALKYHTEYDLDSVIEHRYPKEIKDSIPLRRVTESALTKIDLAISLIKYGHNNTLQIRSAKRRSQENAG